MKALLVSGYGDYNAVNVENALKGTKVIDVINDITKYWHILKKSVFIEDVYDLSLEVLELDVSEESFNLIKEHLSDYDSLKHTNIYLETETF